MHKYIKYVLLNLSEYVTVHKYIYIAYICMCTYRENTFSTENINISTSCYAYIVIQDH